MTSVKKTLRLLIERRVNTGEQYGQRSAVVSFVRFANGLIFTHDENNTMALYQMPFR